MLLELFKKNFWIFLWDLPNDPQQPWNSALTCLAEKILSGLCETLFNRYFDFVLILCCKTGNTFNTCFPFSVNFISLCQHPECFKEVLSDFLESPRLCILLNCSLRITVPRPISGDKEKEAKLSGGCFEGRLSLSCSKPDFKTAPITHFKHLHH